MFSFVKFLILEIFEGIQGSLNLDSLVMFQKSKTEKHLYNALVDSVCRILKLIKHSFFIYENTPPEIYHFYPSYLGHFVTLVYPSNVSDDDLSTYLLFSPFARNFHIIIWQLKCILLYLHS